MNHEAEILSRIIAPERHDLPEEAARAILALAFPQRDVDRMNELASKAREGTLTPCESDELAGYERVGCLLGILQSKARQSIDADDGAE